MSEENDNLTPQVWKKEEEVALQRRNQERKIAFRQLREHWDRMDAWEDFKNRYSKRLCNLLYLAEKSIVSKKDDSFEFTIDQISYTVPTTPPKYIDETLRDNLDILENKISKSLT